MKDIDAIRDELTELWNELGARGASSDAVLGTLREGILSGILRPDQNFAEEDFASAFGVSRTPVREAILRLETEGLVERLSRRGFAIKKISPDEVLEIYEVRTVLDGLAAELAAGHINPPQMAELEWINDRMRTAGEGGDYEHMSKLNLEFHDLLAVASGNSFLLRQIREVQDRVRRFERTTFSYGNRWKTAVEEHEEIVEWLKSGDADGARDAACSHMTAAKQVRLKMVEDDKAEKALATAE